MTKSQFLRICVSGRYCDMQTAIKYARDRRHFTSEDLEKVRRYKEEKHETL